MEQDQKDGLIQNFERKNGQWVPYDMYAEVGEPLTDSMREGSTDQPRDEHYVDFDTVNSESREAAKRNDKPSHDTSTPGSNPKHKFFFDPSISADEIADIIWENRNKDAWD